LAVEHRTGEAVVLLLAALGVERTGSGGCRRLGRGLGCLGRGWVLLEQSLADVGGGHQQGDQHEGEDHHEAEDHTGAQSPG